MITYITTIWARTGHEEQVTRFYQDLEPLLRAAPGYHGRRILRAMPGTMEAAIRRIVPPQEAAGHGDHGPQGVHFVIVEQWDTVDQRVAFSRSASGSRGRDLFPHILPDHSHEFYEDVTPD